MTRVVPLRFWAIGIAGLAASFALLVVFDESLSDVIVPSKPSTALAPSANSSQQSPLIPLAGAIEPRRTSWPHSYDHPQADVTTAPRKGAAKSLYSLPSDPVELGKRFFGAAAAEIQTKWQRESRSRDAERVEEAIYDTYTRAEATEGVRAIECRATLCRVQLDKVFATANPAATKRMAGKLGPNGWLLNGARHDELLAFVPIDFEPM